MLKSYLKIAYRNILKFKLYSSINILGLAAGIASCLIILLYVQDQFSYDKFGKNYDKIYRLVLDIKNSNNTNKYSTTSPPMGPYLVDNFPEVKEAVRVRIGSSALMESDNVRAYEEKIVFADSNFFNLFSFPLAKGNPKSALNEPNEIVITSEMAKKYFGSRDPVGKIIKMDKRFNLKVTGVISPKKFNSHTKFDFLISFSTFPSTLPPGYSINDWGWTSFFTYIQINNNNNLKNLEAKLPTLIKTIYTESTAQKLSLHLEPLKDIYFDNERIGDFGVSGNKSSLYIISVIAFLILVIAGFNFVNLSTARAVKRSKEVGIRKVLGADRSLLIKQFLGESIMIAVISVLVALTITELILPVINSRLNINISLTDLGPIYLISFILFLPLLLGFVAGIFPAFVLSNFTPSEVLKENIYSFKTGLSLRKFLITAQFLITTVLIIGTLFVTEQMNYIKDKNLGFDKENVLILKLRGKELLNKFETIKNSMLNVSEVVSIGGARNSMDGDYGTATVNVPNDKNNISESYDINIYPVDYGFFKTLDIKFISGRAFDKSFATDSSAFILNETAAKMLNLKNNNNTLIGFAGGHKGNVLGVVKDFNYTSLHNKIAPLVFFMSPTENENMFMRIKSGDISETITKIKNTWDRVVPGYPLDYSFFNQKLDRIYTSDQRFATIIYYFSSLVIFIASFGLLGLITLSIEQRIKEVGIRKVLGASGTSISILLSKEFLKLVLIANLIAWPVSYYVMTKWLQDFAYRINISWEIFILALGITLLIALITVSYQSIKAANTNPVESLRNE